MKGKLALVGGVGVAWLLTFVVLGGHVFPAVSSNNDHPKAQASGTPASTPSTGVPTQSAHATSNPATSGPGKDAVSAEKITRSAPLAGQTLEARPNPRRVAAPTLIFRMATFNALGSSHTLHSKKRQVGPARMTRGAQYVLDNKISIVGFQEMQENQRATFLNVTHDKYALYPGNQLRVQDGDTSIAYRLDTWKLIHATTVTMPYFHGEPRSLPVLLLRNRQTGIEIYMTDFHNPADVHGPAGRWRSADKVIQIALFKQLEKTGRPVFVAGDMNEHRTWACDILGPTDMRVAVGGDGRNGCSVTTNRIIDWIAASYAVQFVNYNETQNALIESITDHPVIYADAKIDSRDFPRSVHLP
ncbi:MAG: hypothetical protein JWP74_131 [Marmoricola sp.]|nr:hypothetical protein [Marmoricola sp.]